MSLDILLRRNEWWTGQLALDLLPENNGPKVEVLSGCVIVTPGGGFDRRAASRELSYRLKLAARRAGLWLYHEVNIMSGDDLFIPDIAVLRTSGAGRVSMKITEAVLLGEIVSPGNRRKDVIDRPREYAAAGVPFFLRNGGATSQRRLTTRRGAPTRLLTFCRSSDYGQDAKPFRWSLSPVSVHVGACRPV